MSKHIKQQAARVKMFLKYFLLTICGITAFLVFNRIVRRDDFTVGGEAMFIFFPLIWRLTERVIKDWCKHRAAHFENKK